MIRGVYVEEEGKGLCYSKEYGKSPLQGDWVKHMRCFADSALRGCSEGSVKHVKHSSLQLHCKGNETHVFFIVSDETDASERRTEDLNDLETFFMEKFKEEAKRKESVEELDRFIDSLAMVKVVFIGYPSVGKTTIVKQLRYRRTVRNYIGPIVFCFQPDTCVPLINIWDIWTHRHFADLRLSTMVRAVIMRVNPDVVIVVTDSTYENVMKSKKMVRFARENARCANIIGIANKQDLPNTLTSKQVEQILQIPTHGLVAIDWSMRDRLFEILTTAVLER